MSEKLVEYSNVQGINKKKRKGKKISKLCSEKLSTGNKKNYYYHCLLVLNWVAGVASVLKGRVVGEEGGEEEQKEDAEVDH